MRWKEGGGRKIEKGREGGREKEGRRREGGRRIEEEGGGRKNQGKEGEVMRGEG